MFKLWSDLGTNSNDIASLVIETKNKKSKNVVIRAQYRQPDGDFKQYKTVTNKPTRVSRNNATIIGHLKGTLLQI